MCITFFFANPEPDDPQKYKFILLMNRDENMARPTLAAAWKDGVLAGWDAEQGKEGGTWLGLNSRGKVCFLTNVLVGKVVGGAGRGFLVPDYLRGRLSAEDYVRQVSESKTAYNPFNLVAFEPVQDVGCPAYEAHYLCHGMGSLPGEGPVKLNFVQDGIVGISNHPLSEPFLKTERGLREFRKVIADCNNVNSVAELQDRAFALLGDRGLDVEGDPHMRKQMDLAGAKPYEEALARRLTAIHPEFEGYGTRMQTLILVDHEMNVEFVERTKVPVPGGGFSWQVVEHCFKALPAS